MCKNLFKSNNPIIKEMDESEKEFVEDLSSLQF